jgi:ribonuclease E
MSRQVLLSIRPTGNCWVAVLKDDRPEQVFVEPAQGGSVGSVYKGRVVTVEPAIQSAFIDYGVGRNGFLHVTDVDPAYYRHLKGFAEGPEEADEPEKPVRRPKPPVQDILKRGQEILIQVLKAGVGNKGATTTTYLSLAGRYLVLMPCLNRLGVSRQVPEAERPRLRQAFRSLRCPPGLGFILRSAGAAAAVEELQADMDHLARLWRGVAERIRTVQAPAELYREGDPLERVLREVCGEDTETIWVDEPGACERVRRFFEAVASPLARRVRLHDGPGPLFPRFGIAEEADAPPAAGPR